MTTEQLQEPVLIDAPLPKRTLPLYALFIANVCSYVGDILTSLAIPWLVLQTTGSAAMAGITAFSNMAAVVISAFFGSLLIDRLGYKRSSLGSDLASGIAIALIPLCYMTIGLSFWQLQILVFITGLVQTPGNQARYAMLPDLIKQSQMPAERANSLYDGVRRVAGFIGAPLAGVLIAIIGTSNLLWIDSATFFFSFLLLALAVPKTLPMLQPKSERASSSRHLKEGLAFILRSRLILSIVIVVMITNTLDQGMAAVIQPTYARQIFGNAVALGSLIAAFGGAAFVGTLLFAWIGHRLPRGLTLGLCFSAATALRFFSLALGLPLPVLIICYAISGLLIGPINPILSGLEQEIVPVDMRARVFGALAAGVTLGTPLGALIAGYLVEWSGIQPAILIFGGIYLCATISLLINPAMRTIDKRPS